MLTALEKAKQNGARIIAVNPLPRGRAWCASRTRRRSRGVAGVGTALADLHLPIRLNGDLALFQAIGALLAGVGRRRPRLRRPAHHRLRGVARRTCADLDWDAVRRATGLTRAQIEARGARCSATPSRTVICWAMGITQHRNSVATIKEIANVALLQGNIGKPGAGLCPVRGHSNVQGDRTMGIWERPPAHFLDALREEFGFEPPREHGFDTVEAIKALRDGRAQGVLRAWAATSSPPRPTPRSPRRRCATPTSPCTSRPSSTAPTWSPAARR